MLPAKQKNKKMRNIVLFFLLFLSCYILKGQEFQSFKCKALNNVIKTKLFKNNFSFCDTDSIYKKFIIIDTNNNFKGFIYDSICNRSCSKLNLIYVILIPEYHVIKF